MATIPKDSMEPEAQSGAAGPLGAVVEGAVVRSSSHGAQADSEPPEDSGTFLKPRSCRVLIVEDDPEAQWRLARTLTVRGNRVVGTSSRQGAHALIAQWDVDLVLVDDTLPDGDGAALVQEIRAQYPKVHAVLMIAKPENEQKGGGSRVATELFVAKPLDTDTLSKLTKQARARKAS